MEYLLIIVIFGLILVLVWVFYNPSSPTARHEKLQEINSQLNAVKAVLEERLENLVARNSLLMEDDKIKNSLLEQILEEKNVLYKEKVVLSTQNEALLTQLENLSAKVSLSEEKSEAFWEKYQSTKESLTQTIETNKHLREKLDTQTRELEEIGKKFSQQFELLANRIFEEKSRKFTDQNKDNMERILHPLSREFDSFKQKVHDTYDRESKERFSLELRVKELVQLNQQISEDAKNLTKALKGNSKTQGNWGEAILETILQNSGLEKGRHYEIQSFLKSESGEYLLGPDGKRMQPDVIINYPDDRKVIIDAKVSLNAYERFFSESQEFDQQIALNAHLRSIKNHIDQLSARQYDGYAKALDFVILFVPIEAAYIQAVQSDPQLWEYAYKRRVLLISSSNLIAALKMIKDFWIRDDQTKNAIEIAERGGRLYDKFVGLIQSLEEVGKHLDKSRKSHQLAVGQLLSGNGNLIGQVEKLRNLGVNAKSQIPARLLDKNQFDLDNPED